MLPNSSRYEDLSGKLVEVFPQLKDGTFKVTYTDWDGDEVRPVFSEIYFISLMQLPISTDEELSIAIAGVVNKLYIHREKPVIPEYSFIVRATGRAREKKGFYLGVFTRIKREELGRPVYWNHDSETIYLQSLQSGRWGVFHGRDASWPEFRSTDGAPSPDLCKQWEYKDVDDDYKYKHGEITVTVKK